MLGLCGGATGGDTGEEPEDKLNTYVAFAVDGFKHLLNKLNADRSAAEECRKRVDEFKDLWDQYYIRRDLLVDELSDAKHRESLTGTPEPAEEALKRLESSVRQLVIPYADEGLRVYKSGKALGMVKAVFVVTVCKAQADDLKPAIDNARKVLKALRLNATAQKKVATDITAMSKEYKDAIGQDMPDLGDSIIEVADKKIEMVKSNIEAEISVSAPVELKYEEGQNKSPHFRLKKSTLDVWVDGKALTFKDRPGASFSFLLALCEKPNETVKHKDICDSIGSNATTQETVRRGKKNLIDALKDAGKEDVCERIETKRGIGYRLITDVEPTIEE